MCVLFTRIQLLCSVFFCSGKFRNFHEIKHDLWKIQSEFWRNFFSFFHLPNASRLQDTTVRFNSTSWFLWCLWNCWFEMILDSPETKSIITPKNGWFSWLVRFLFLGQRNFWLVPFTRWKSFQISVLKSFVESCQNLEETIAFRCEEWTDTMSTLVQVKSSYTGTSDGCGGSLENLKKRSQVGMVIFGQCLKKSLEHTLDIVLLCITTINTIDSISVQIFGTGRTSTFTTFDWSWQSTLPC